MTHRCIYNCVHSLVCNLLKLSYVCLSHCIHCLRKYQFGFVFAEYVVCVFAELFGDVVDEIVGNHKIILNCVRAANVAGRLDDLTEKDKDV